MYSVVKTQLSYASTLKALEMSIKAGKSKILSLTSVTKTNNSSPMTEKLQHIVDTRFCGCFRRSCPKIRSSQRRCKYLESSREKTRSPKKENQKLRIDQVPKGANDPDELNKKFGALKDMAFAPSPSSTRVRSLSPRKQKGDISPIKQT